MGQEKGDGTKQTGPDRNPVRIGYKGLWRQGRGVWAPQRWAGGKADEEEGPPSGTENSWRTQSPNDPAVTAGSWVVLCS